ncbi:MAG TPA: alkaline phosphatase PhoX [Burkholderiales bacterium]|nr:alkaline phosphatase PhoX [Burkholderiales bacterium]
MDRRNFLKRSSLVAGGVITAATLDLLSVHSVWARDNDHDSRGASAGCRPSHGRNPPKRQDYGTLKPTADQTGAMILALPEGFEYVSFSRTGDPMNDGFATPAIHDGMAAFNGPDDTIRLIRNHELRNAAGNFAFGVVGPSATRYDALASGGCTTIDYDPRSKRVVRDFISINGTIVNCSGGLAYKNTGWITCEETTVGPANGYTRKHGYSFLVPAAASGPSPAQPLTAMGRFTHEAALADNATGIVYETEDAGDNSGFYRFLPNDPKNLLAGGLLQMAKIKGVTNYDTRSGQAEGEALEVEWVTIENPDPDPISSATSCFAQGFAKGGARFNRLEGIFRGEDDSMYFVSTSGGNAKYGQLWKYQTKRGRGTLRLVFESPSGSVLDSPDNLCVTPSGGILFCEDDASNDGDIHLLAPGLTNINRLVGMGCSGKPFEFAINIFSDSEFAGACFSPDGEILFVNIQGGNATGSGMTVAITGPWRKGPL